jgi:hypothetical protein
MKKSILILGTFIVFISHFINAQQSMDTLNGNSVSAIIFDEGRLFNNPNMASAGYEFSAGSGNNLIFSTGFWFGGTNQNGDVKMMNQLFGIERTYRGGPVSVTDDYLDTTYIYAYEKGIWTVSKSEIIYHIDNFNQPGYAAPDAILKWPGNGIPRDNFNLDCLTSYQIISALFLR